MCARAFRALVSLMKEVLQAQPVIYTASTLNFQNFILNLGMHVVKNFRGKCVDHRKESDRKV